MKGDIILNIASESDCRDLWLWRNHPAVRRYFFNRKRISWQEHKEWFYSKVKDGDARIYIAKRGKDKVGVIRFEEAMAVVRVSVNLNPSFFGRGLGSKIIKLGTEKLLNEMKTKKPVVAETTKDNIVSQKAFSKAGYRYAEETEDKVVYKR